jgi:serine/threonine protein kinase
MSRLITGQVVAQRFRIERLVGAGGMGAVYEATDLTTSRRHAVKVLHPHFLHHPVIPRRFMQEAAAAQALVTPHAVKVEGTGTLDDGTPFLVMEFLDGVDLGEITRRAGGRLPLDRALAIVDQVAEALQEAHARGIIHRDLKPDNIFLLQTPSGELAKVVDFGISKILSREEGAKLTQTGTTLGTPHYMPLEQLRGVKDLDGRVDVYALGVILYQVLTGVRPFDGNTYEEVILQVATGAARPLGEIRPDLPPGIVQVVGRAMMREREQRIGSMQELRAALAPFHVPNSYPPAPRSSSPSGMPVVSSWPPAPAVTLPSVAGPPRKRVRAVMLAVGIAVVLASLVLLIAGGAGAWLYWSNSPTPAASSCPTPDRSPSIGTTNARQVRPERR